MSKKQIRAWRRLIKANYLGKSAVILRKLADRLCVLVQQDYGKE